MGDKAEDIMKSLEFIPPEKNDCVGTLIKKFTIPFGGKINVVYERARYKPISELSTRLQRFRMRLVPFRYVIHHVPGKTMHAADTLSRMPSDRNAGAPDIISEIKLEEAAAAEIPSSAKMWNSIKEAQDRNSTCKLLREAILRGWPEDPQQLPVELKPFHQYSGQADTPMSYWVQTD
ncbi:hypothetical protein FOCC_FOCC012810 [Frankliniella occidentalis]|nr:hypothetical protein FOCC_FOCC012810 [Frankliniella occidentalis]